MNNIHVSSARNRNESKMFSPVNFSITNYSTDSQSKAMKNAFGDSLLFNNINNLHLIPDPLKKNLADSVITGTMEQRKEPDKFEKPQPMYESRTLASLGSITNFFSGMFNVMTTMFQKRASSPTTQYYDCFDAVDEGQMTPSLAWHPAKFEMQNRNTTPNSKDKDNMSAITNCKDTISKVHILLNGNVETYPAPVYGETRSLEDSFEDAFCPESIVHLANDTFIECFSAYNQHCQELLEAEAPVRKTEFCKDSIDVVNNITETKNTNMDMSEKETESQIVSSCEDKLNKLKELLQCKYKQNINSVQETMPIPIKDVISSSFGNEIDSIQETKSSFDEVNGRFYSTSADSDDSFQIVFTDRKRIPSDCESEDSFIVFDESPECYTNNDVFGSDSESETEDSDYVMTCLNHSLSRTFGDLTDDNLYGTDVVDCAVQTHCGVEIEKTNTSNEQTKLIVEDKKQKPPKKVRFSTDPPKVHVMRVWAFAARQARAGHWERHALDRERFRRRIADVEMAISWVLKPQHRTRVMFQRFMPWWNAQKRKELEDNKALEEKEKDTECNKENVIEQGDLSVDRNDNINASDVKIKNISLTESNYMKRDRSSDDAILNVKTVDRNDEDMLCELDLKSDQDGNVTSPYCISQLKTGQNEEISEEITLCAENSIHNGVIENEIKNRRDNIIENIDKHNRLELDDSDT